ncbi:MAG: hypothetical protein ACE5EX_10095 [Phycisphaerae bacterium]
MTALVVSLAIVGSVVVALSRERIETKPTCPNCREALESFEVDRCPNCMLWQPPDRGRPSYRWRRHRLTLGLLLLPARPARRR